MTTEWEVDSTMSKEWVPDIKKGDIVFWRWNHDRKPLTISRVLEIEANTMRVCDANTNYPYWVALDDVRVFHRETRE